MRAFSWAAGTTVVLVGGLVLFGWATGNATLKGVRPGFPLMQPNTALALMLTGAALLLRLREGVPAPWRAAGSACAVAIGFFGLLALVEHATGWHSGLGEVLVPAEVRGTGLRGRPSVPTATGLVLLSLALLLFDNRTRRGRRPAEYLALAVICLAVVATTGYLYGMPGLYGFWPRLPGGGVALHTALSLMLAAAGVIAARPEAGAMAVLLSPRSGGATARRLLLGALVIPAIAVLLLLGGDAGLLDPSFATALLAVTGLVVVLWLVFSTGRALNRLDEERERVTEEQARLAAVVESSRDAIFSESLEGIILSWNACASELFGYTPEEVLGRAGVSERLVAPEYAQKEREYRARVLQGEQVATFEAERVCKNRERFHAAITLSPLRDHQGQIMGISSITRDITHMRDAQELLRRSEENLRQLIEHASDGIFIADRDGRYVEVNTSGCRLLGFKRAELLGKRIQDVLFPEDWPRLEQVRRALLDGRGALAEWRMRREDGGCAEVEVSATILPDGRWLGFARDISERKRAEERLQLSEAKFAGIVAIALDAIVSVDEEMRITIFNEGAERIFGYARAEMLGQPMDVLLPERFRARHRAHVRAFAEGPEAALRMGDRRELFGLRRNGEEFPAEASISKLEVGGTRLYTVVLRDVSKRKRAEDALRRSEERFRLALRHGRVIVFHQDRALRYTWLHNPDMDYPVERILGRTDAELLPPPIAERMTALKQGVLQSGVGAQGEYELPVRGERHVYQLWVDPLRDRYERVEGVTCVAVDVTERKRVEEEFQFLADAGVVLTSSLDFREIASSLARLFTRELADFCLIDLLRDGELPQRVAVAAADPGQAERAEALRSFALDRTRPYLAHDVLETSQPVLRGEVSPADVEALSQGAEHLALLRSLGFSSMLGVPLIARGRLLGAIVCVTGRRRYGPSELRLAQEVARRGALAVDNAQLYWTAQRATQARDEVLGVVAHDLRNPLNAIVLSASKLQRRPPEVSEERRARQPSETILAASRMMNRLIQDLLDVARIEARQLSMERAPQPVAPLVQEALEAARPLAPTVTFEGDVPERLPPVDADRDRVLQVLSNLIGNAVKFTPRGGRITVAAWPFGDEVLFAVQDTGAGILPSHLEHIFDRFWKADVTDRRRGAGLGLAISKGIVEAHGGRIWVESEPGEGSTFFFTLMVARQPMAETGTARA
ncbi:MAG TPA: PAS domain S-box protein [Myxococcaceae bacterium]|nr:PAS domain S-box protein [Myxococcaceae bacterium]